MQRKHQALLKAFKSSHAKVDSVEAGIAGYKRLVRKALTDYLWATRMAHDPCLPQCISALAREITRTDGVSLRPQLRSFVEELLEDRELCRRVLKLLESDRALLDSDLGELLYPMVKTLLIEEMCSPQDRRAAQ